MGSGEIGDGDENEDDKMGIREAGMPWKGLQGLQYLKVGVGDTHLLEGLQYLTSLRSLRIPKLKDVGWLQVESSFKPLQNLGILSIGFGKETFDLPKSGIQHLHSLWSLSILDCKELYLCWKTLLSMPKLSELELSKVERVIDDTMMVMVVEPHCRLHHLVIDDCAGAAEWIDDIPWISLSSSLQKLDLFRMKEMENIPNGIQHLSSLQWLFIFGCEKVTSLPNWFPKLTSLRDLHLLDCSAELRRRCEQGKGDDWPLIRHIPKICIIATSPNQRGSDNYESREEELEEKGGEGSTRMGCCAGISLSRFNRRSITLTGL